MALLARRGRFEPAAANEELARAAAEAAAGAPDKARKRYAKLARALASAPDELRGLRRAALLGGADLLAGGGDLPGALALYGQAFALCEDPARELPRAALRRLAAARMRLAQGPLAAPLAYVRAAADGVPEPAGEDPDTSPGGQPVQPVNPVLVTRWLHEVCAQGSIVARDEATARAVEGLAGWDWPVLARAAVLMQANRGGEAERFLAGAAPVGSGEVWFRWAVVLVAAGRFPQAVAAFDEALRRGAPTGPAAMAGPGTGSPWARGGALVADSLLFRGIARQRLGQPEPAQADFLAAVAHAPDDPRPRDALARLALQLGGPEAAREQFEAALAAAPGYAPARLGLALLNERAGWPQQAAEDYRAAVGLAPRWRPGRVRLGAALVTAGAYAQAVEVLRPEAGSDDVLGRTAGFHLGAALFASGDARGALAAWEAVGGEDLKPHLAMARDRVARMVLGSDPGAARVLWQHAMGEHPLPVYRAGLHEAALREAGMLLLMRRDVPQAREHAGKALEFARRLYGTDGAQRADRLEAMRRLAGGDGETLAQRPVDSSTSLRERCHVLAGLVLTGRLRQAATGLALIPQEHAADAMPARLRALVAESDGEWRIALEAHLRSLTAPAPVPPAPDGAAEACGGCGREAGPVFRVADSASPRCLVCLRTGLAAAVACARRVEALGELEPVFAAWTGALGEAAGAAGAGTSLALLRAESGDHEAALELLGGQYPVERAAVLVRRAEVDLRQGRATRAVVDLRDAVTLSPAPGPAAEALGLLGELEAFVHASRGRAREAFEGYVAALLADPGHPRLLHAVGLTGRRLGTGLDSPDSPDTAVDVDVERVWSWTIGALVAGLYLPDVWGRTASVSGRALAPGQAGQARGLLLDRLGEDLEALDRAAGRTGLEVDSWGVRLGMEMRCAEAFAQEELRIGPEGGGAGRRLILGPALHGLLAANAGANEALTAWLESYGQAVAPYADGSRSSTLTEVFGLLHPTLGAHRFLILQGRFAAAVAALDALSPQARGADGQQLLAEALVREGERLYRERTWDGSLTAFARAARLGVRELEAEQVRMAADCGIYASRALLAEGAPLEDRARAAGLLEKALELSPGTEQLAVELTAAYVQWGRRLAEEREYEQALLALRRALGTLPEDEAAGEALGVVLAEYAEVLGRPGPGGDRARAVQLWREALGPHPDPEYARAGLAEALQVSARAAALAGERSAAEDLMAEAVGLDPDFDGSAAEAFVLAPGRISASLIGFALEERVGRPFGERAEALRVAHGFEASLEVRAAMWEIWRAEALARAEARQFAEAELLLVEAVELSADLAMREDTLAELTALYRGHALDAAGRRRRGEALEAIGRALALAPDSGDLQSLRHSIETSI